MTTTTPTGRNVTIRAERSTHTFTIQTGFIGGDRRSVSSTTYTAWDAETTEYVGAISRDATGRTGPASIRDAGRWF
jgi:hypothetical protein